MNKSKIALAVVATVFAGSVSAGSIDYRAEYKHEDKEYQHRIKIGTSVKAADKTKVYFSAEQKFNSDDKGDFWYEMERGDSEFDWGVRYDLTKNWYLQPGMPITFSDERTTYKPQFRVGYKSSFGLTTALRYRHEFQTYTSSKEGSSTTVDGGSLLRAGKTFQQGKVTLTGSYKFSQESLKDLKLSYEANYNHNYEDVRIENNNNWGWDAGLIVGYQMGNFRPFMELWNVKTSGSTSSDRQLRTRLGLKYYF
ncbi:oligogalacturonate-specific porin KdgM family protein [Vibrio rarus]|uniref:oligogalacturonate-specific porin KdgM family protein n=1 Tax=Vibrio rarus TaxID=413403 RepID=UPI0021C25A60|nr:oligogalacturonate-specific porin KdgM family protein [Vibrio rarus]